MNDPPPESTVQQMAAFLYEMGFLKQVRRAGWSLAGISDSETIAEHSFRTAIVGLILASEEGADAARTALLCLLHDSQESRTGDIPSVGRPYVTTAHNIDVTADQTAGFPPSTGQFIRDLVEEYEAAETIEAQLAHEADKLECVFQAREYQAQRSADTTPWIKSCTDRIKSRTGQRLAKEALETSPSRWWQEFGDSYNDLRRNTYRRPSPVNGAEDTVVGDTAAED
jgi:5'-deoxynucleotidase YfbR-like HD superfamily hydrolase